MFLSSLTSTISQFAHPLFAFFAWILAGSYSLVPNYAVAIALLTIAVMLAVFPITRRSTRSMLKMQLLSPELKKLQTRLKPSPSMTIAEQQDARRRLNEESMALYKENGVSPTGGCLPLLLQLPIFLVLYNTIKGLIHTVASHGRLVPKPLYVNSSTRLYHSVVHANGALHAFGINLANAVRTSGLSWGQRAPLAALVVVAVGLQFVQMRQLAGRTQLDRAASPPLQLEQVQKVFPLVFAVIYLAIPAAVNVYFIVSSLCRIAQQDYMYRHDLHIRTSVARLQAESS